MESLLVGQGQNLTRKLCLESPTHWGHHRDGWRYATNAITESLHSAHGVQLYDWYDAIIRDGVRATRPWVGFVHNVVSYPKEYQHKYKRLFSLDSVSRSPVWAENQKMCRGIFTLSTYTASYLRTVTKVPVSSVLHPIADDAAHFSMDRFFDQPRVIHAGQWLRKYHAFCDLKCRWKKIMLMPGEVWREDFQAVRSFRPNCDVEMRSHITNQEYDDMLSSSIVFLYLYDVAACNTVLECLIRGTPIVVNRHPAIEEYLGVDYPLFYDTVEQAGVMMEDITLLEMAHRYLETATIRPRLTAGAFVAEIAGSDVYRGLPTSRVF